MPLILFFLELFIFIFFIKEIGFLYTMLVYLIPTVIGFFIFRRQNRNFLMELQSQGNPPKEMIKKGLTFLSAILLIFPSFFSKALGLFLILPFVKSLLAWGFQGFLISKVFSQSQRFSQSFGSFGGPGGFKFYYKSFGNMPGSQGQNQQGFDFNSRNSGAVSGSEDEDIIDVSYKKIEDLPKLENKKE